MINFAKFCRNQFALITKKVIGILLDCIGFCLILVVAIFKCAHRRSKGHKPRLVWGTAPIITLSYMSQAMKQAGFMSEVIVNNSSSIFLDKQFDHVIGVNYHFFLGRLIGSIVARVRSYFFFSQALFKFDIFHYFFDGGILKQTYLARFELFLLKLTGKKLVLMPYGADSFVYDLLPDPYLRHALSAHYPELGNAADKIQTRLRRATRQADCVIGCLVHFINLPRWDILPLVYYPIDLQSLTPIYPRTTGTIRIAHAPNHRIIKGTEFLIAAVEKLQQEGVDIELILIEKKLNQEALRLIAKADILVDQLLMGYALAAIEGLALGKIVISGIQETPQYHFFKTYSYLNECPIIPASVDTIYEVLKQLISKRQDWPAMGIKARLFAERRHSYPSCIEMFTAIYQKIWSAKPIDLINFYHPLFRAHRKEQNSHSQEQFSLTQ